MSFDNLKRQIERTTQKKLSDTSARNKLAALGFGKRREANLRQFILTQANLMAHFGGLSPEFISIDRASQKKHTVSLENNDLDYYYKQYPGENFLVGQVTQSDDHFLYSNLAWKIFPRGTMVYACLEFIVDYISEHAHSKPEDIADKFIDDLVVSDWLKLVSLAYEYDVANNKIFIPDSKIPCQEVCFLKKNESVPSIYPNVNVNPGMPPAAQKSKGNSARAIGYVSVALLALALCVGLVAAGSALVATGIFFPLTATVALFGGALALAGTPLLLAELGFCAGIALLASGSLFSLGAAAVKMITPSPSPSAPGKQKKQWFQKKFPSMEITDDSLHLSGHNYPNALGSGNDYSFNTINPGNTKRAPLATTPSTVVSTDIKKNSSFMNPI